MQKSSGAQVRMLVPKGVSRARHVDIYPYICVAQVDSCKKAGKSSSECAENENVVANCCRSPIRPLDLYRWHEKLPLLPGLMT